MGIICKVGIIDFLGEWLLWRRKGQWEENKEEEKIKLRKKKEEKRKKQGEEKKVKRAS
jgi:hypothetical protein